MKGTSTDLKRDQVKALEEEDAETCKSCGNTYRVEWLKPGEDFNDFGDRYCPFCGLLPQEWEQP
jgi:hypothetical protein